MKNRFRGALVGLACVDALGQHRADYALGSRFLGGAIDLPPARRLLLKAATWFTRLTSGFSKKIENLTAAVSLHFMHYNFGRPHQTLTKRGTGIRTTPAMAAGVADHVWSLTEIAALLDSNDRSN